MNIATENNHLDIVEYLHNNRRMNYAAVHGIGFHQPDHNYPVGDISTACGDISTACGDISTI